MIHQEERGTSSQSSQQLSKQISLPEAAKTQSWLINIQEPVQHCHCKMVFKLIYPGEESGPKNASFRIYYNEILYITIQRCTHKMDDMVYKCLTIFIPGIGHRAIRLITSNNNQLTPVSPRRQFDGHYDYYFHPRPLLFHYFIQLCPQLYALSENQLYPNVEEGYKVWK